MKDSLTAIFVNTLTTVILLSLVSCQQSDIITELREINSKLESLEK